ncbi:GNAT family N-acetyltransferase [Streptomyces sp. FXJ1.172]|uniref:GNAT family N-acetyltransferase n=1 Tax=Streptomyces sp. FXJ1.172 TaxID=710705 RepID=UPI0007D007D0|nr:GNAT family N-acetyltransferase [Streptomyces sp. FXJ1.172]WEO96740.1 GNAT family N-acetyltransferase [Streptomyces sp. FXJ1.172]
MRTISGDDVNKAVAGCTAALRPAVDRDWTAVGAGRLEWSCHATAFHMAEDCVAYAANLAGRAEDAYVPFAITLDEGTGNAGLLHVIETAGALLAAAVGTAPPGVRAFHPYPFRSADREGFAAMGIAEVLLHTHDIAEGLGLAYTPDEELAESVLTWLFPQVQPGPAAWPTLLWATGRGELPGRAPVTDWRWHNNLVLPADRVTLTGLRPAVARDLRLGGDGGLDWAEGGPYQGTRDACGSLVKAYEAGVHRPEFGVFALVRHEDGRAIGGMGFHGAPNEHGWVEIGYDLVEEARGQGYATEALRTLTNWALARDDVQMVFATIEPANLPSQRVVSRAGFTRATVEEGERIAHAEQGLEDGLQLYVRRA